MSYVKTFENYRLPKFSIIFSGDYQMQVLTIIQGNSEEAWEQANDMAEDGTFDEMKIEHYDVMEFENIHAMNLWILDSVKDSRK